MLAHIGAAEKAKSIEICQKDMVAVFRDVAEHVRQGNLPGYQIVVEKPSGAEILYKVGERQSMMPLAAMANEKVFPLPAPINPRSMDALMQLLIVNTTLREIAGAASPAATPA